MGRSEIIAALQNEVFRLQGFKSCKSKTSDLGLGPINDAFPNAIFPLGAIHEFFPAEAYDAAATTGFMAGLLASIMGNSGTVVWISSSRSIFPPALKSFGIQPDRVIFISSPKEKDNMWAMEEALKCSALSAVVGELWDITFTASRRLQLAVEQSQVTGFILRKPTTRINPTASAARWKVNSLPGEPADDLPGIGFPVWRITLMSVKNGKPGEWDVAWKEGRFHTMPRPGESDGMHSPREIRKKAG